MRFLTYTYDPSEINDSGLNQMRFELGDTMVENGENACIFCDEEYKAVLSKRLPWKKAKIECLRAIVMKLSYEVDYKVADMDLRFSTRYQHFKDMLDKLEKSSQSVLFGNYLICNSTDKEPYFYLGMQENKKAW